MQISNNQLKNRFCHVLWNEDEAVQSVSSKCKNCTLEESAVLEYLADTPGATQKKIAEKMNTLKKKRKTLTARSRLIKSVRVMVTHF